MQSLVLSIQVEQDSLTATAQFDLRRLRQAAGGRIMVASAKVNCWEFWMCGRQPGGKNTDRLGVCPTATACEFDGINGGHAAGRSCWAVVGTLCAGEVQGTFAQKFGSCLLCPFYWEVERQKSGSFVLMQRRVQRAELAELRRQSLLRKSAEPLNPLHVVRPFAESWGGWDEV
jgi:hypothetical protein